MNPRQKTSLPSVERSVTKVEPPPWDAYFAEMSEEIGNGEPRRPDEFTVYDLMDRLKIHRSTAKEKLENDVASGKLKCRMLKIKQNRVKLYSIA
jgi:tryptophanyl-tRNA synthetase